MNDTNLIQQLEALKSLTPRKEILESIRTRVFDTIKAAESTPMAAVVSPIQPARYMSPFSRGIFATAGVAFAVMLVVVNQLPMHGAYQDSITSIVQASQLADSLEKSEYPADTAHEVRVATEHARATLDTLKLKGQFATYTQEQCLHAYIIYDSYLDYLGDSLDAKMLTIKDPKTLAAFKDLRAYVADSHNEAQKRINMYPPAGE